MTKGKELRAIGRRIQEIREQGDMTQGQLAERANLTANYIGRIERGESQPTLAALLAIAEGLKVNSSSLFTYLDRALTKEEIKQRILELLAKL